MGSTASHRADGVFAPGVVVGQYAIVREVGRGGMCLVYEAKHAALAKTVAIKTLKADYAHEAVVKQRFLREGRAASRIRHPNAIDVFDVGELNGAAYMVMEFLHGQDLAARLGAEGALPTTVAVDLLLPVLSAISTAHEHGVVHRDLKPANIFLSQGRHGVLVPKVVDFGISKLSEEDPQAAGLTGTDALLGTPYFMAPEQVRGARHTVPATDQYALGVILYQCLTGRRPFEGSNLYNTLELIMQGRYARPRAWRADLPEALEAVITRAMSHDASQRFGSVAELGAALLPFASPAAQGQWMTEFGGVRVSAPPAVAASQDAMTQTIPIGAQSFVAPTIETLRATTAELPAARESMHTTRRSSSLLTVLFLSAAAVSAVLALFVVKSRRTTRPDAPPPAVTTTQFATPHVEPSVAPVAAPTASSAVAPNVETAAGGPSSPSERPVVAPSVEAASARRSAETATVRAPRSHQASPRRATPRVSRSHGRAVPDDIYVRHSDNNTSH